jgi:hypothetical protein
MRILRLGVLGALVTVFVVSVTAQSLPTQRPSPPTQRPISPAVGVSLSPSQSTAVVAQYCAPCHSDRGKAGGLTLAAFDAGKAEANAEIAEKMIRKLRVGMMPPPGAKRPDAGTLLGLAIALETHIDHAASLNPNPGWRPFQRLNRAEYARSVRDLLELDIDVAAFLPPDTVSGGFDNVADVQAPSATLMEGYVRAASRIATLAVGDRT